MEPKILLLILSFLLCSFLGAAVVILVRGALTDRSAWIGQRLRRRENEAPPLELELAPDYDDRPGFFARFEIWFYRLVGETGLSLAPDVALLIAVACGLTLCGVLLLWQNDFLAAAVGLLVGIVLVVTFYLFKRGRRRVAIQEQLPDVMDLLARAVRAGESLDQAMEMVGQAANAPLGPEFRRCARQLDMGLSINAAMRSMMRRAPIAEVRILASTLVLQRRTGGSLPAMLDRLASVIRDRINYHRQFRAATGSGRISTLMIAAAGPLVAVYMLIFQREYFDRFFETFAGNVMLVTAVSLQLIGLLWVYLLLKSDY